MPHLSVAENIFLGAAPTRGLGLIDWRRLYARHGGSCWRSRDGRSPPDTPLHRLSLAERQMVEIAKALRAGQRRCW